MRGNDTSTLQLSVFDRLLDDDPANAMDPLKSRQRSNRELLDAVRRDLENLLNTRSCGVALDPALIELENSILNYGIMTVGSTVYSVPENREKFRDEVEQVIRRFEPRFLRVSVSLVDEQDLADRTIRFRVDALLDAHPAPEPIVFNSVLDPSTLGITIATPRHV